MILPESFVNRMKTMLSEEEYASFIESYDEEYFSGLRINTLKTENEEWEKNTPFSVDKIPWISNGYYYSPKEDLASKHPYYYAGLYYLQEPSAMTPAQVLDVQPGDRVLDLCAAPGGKSTELAAKLKGKGILVSNDISNSRAKALLKNIELFGVRNAVVVSEAPVKLAKYFEGYFDKILVDAPCSGEGMFRKQPQIMKNWEQYGTEYYNKLQKEILPFAISMLRPGGKLLYSTCTFSPMENEGSIQFVLDNYPEMKVCEPGLKYEGFANGRPDYIENGDPSISNTIRLWPHKLKGEGHFIALLEKSSEGAEKRFSVATSKSDKLPQEALDFISELKCDIDLSRITVRDEKVLMYPEDCPDLSGLRILRGGLLIGEIKKNRFEPSQALANSLSFEDYHNTVSLAPESADVIRYLKGETLEGEYEAEEGLCLVCVGKYPLGWGKLSESGGVKTIKNKYLPGWRMM